MREQRAVLPVVVSLGSALSLAGAPVSSTPMVARIRTSAFLSPAVKNCKLEVWNLKIWLHCDIGDVKIYIEFNIYFYI